MEVKIISQRAKNLAQKKQFFLKDNDFDGQEFNILGGHIRFVAQVENGKLVDFSYGLIPANEALIAFIEALIALSLGQELEQIEKLSLREVDYYLRDDPRIPSFSELAALDHCLKSFISACKGSIQGPYRYDSASLGSFLRLPLVEKVSHAQKAIDSFNTHLNRQVELLDVMDSDLVVNLKSYQDKQLGELQKFLTEVFEEEINIIPDC